jgi:hypothetical protein
MKKLAKAKRNKETLREPSGDDADKDRAAFDEAMKKMLSSSKPEWDLTFIKEAMNESMKRLAAKLRSCPKEELAALDQAIEKMLSL